jgi:hypothetical protein
LFLQIAVGLTMLALLRRFRRRLTLPQDALAALPKLRALVTNAVEQVEGQGRIESTMARMEELARVLRKLASSGLQQQVSALVQFSRAWKGEIVARRMVDLAADAARSGYGNAEVTNFGVEVKLRSRTVLEVRVLDTVESEPRVLVCQTVVAIGAARLSTIPKLMPEFSQDLLGFIYGVALGIGPMILNNRIIWTAYGRLGGGWTVWRNCTISDEFAAAVMAIWLLDRPDELAQLKPLVSRRIYRMIVDYLPQVRELT